MNIDKAAQYIKWIIDQPKELNINEISIDPVQNTRWYNE
jgi:NADP-dependent 3-hydroxy acid dehydrogenase YdfG